MPEAVTVLRGGHFKDERLLNYNKLSTYTISAIQGLNEKSDTLQAKIAHLEETVDRQHREIQLLNEKIRDSGK